MQKIVIFVFKLNEIPLALERKKFKHILIKFSCFLCVYTERAFKKVTHTCLKCQANIDISEICIEPITVLQTKTRLFLGARAAGVDLFSDQRLSFGIDLSKQLRLPVNFLSYDSVECDFSI